MPSLLATFLIFAALSSRVDAQLPTSADCSWRWIRQRVDHFAAGATHTSNATYLQRYCVYSRYWEAAAQGPLLIYTGNESPVEIYVNHVGFLFDLAARMQALVVFAEHRYFGRSVPPLEGMPNCMAYLSSSQALADYAALIQALKREAAGRITAVVAFGGSYGGMLSAWLRMKYPHAVDGAIAASAPIWGFPLDGPQPDGAFRVISRAAGPQCATAMLAAWPLMYHIGASDAGRAWLTQTMGICWRLQSQADVLTTIQWLQQALFFLSEGQYPFASNYFAHSSLRLPAWPLTVACQRLGGPWQVTIEGDVSAVQFSVTAGRVRIEVDWGTVRGNGYSLRDVEATDIGRLLEGVSNAMAVYYEAQGQQQCYPYRTANYGPAPQPRPLPTFTAAQTLAASQTLRDTALGPVEEPTIEPAEVSNYVCSASQVPNPWNALCCNEQLHLVLNAYSGVGHDLYWPPTVRRGTTLASLLGRPRRSLCAMQYAEDGLPGMPTWSDPWSEGDEEHYGGRRIGGASNIVFSNGAQDPWSAGGVLQDVSPTAVALIIEGVGHHADLMTPSDQDPPALVRARQTEEEHIRRWVAEAEALTARTTGP